MVEAQDIAGAVIDPNWPHVVIVGAGFGGLATAQGWRAPRCGSR